MKNPWTKKNPLMSMWLSAANKSMAATRGQVAAAARREAMAAQLDAAQALMTFWTGAIGPRVQRRRR